MILSSADIADLERSDICQKECPGFEKCHYNGLISVYNEENIYGNLTKIFRRGRCEFGIAAQKQKEIEDLIRSSDFPERLRACTFESFSTDGRYSQFSRTKNLVMKAFDAGDSIVLAGDAGVGKTHLAAAMANRLIDSGKSVIFSSFVSLLSDIKNSFDERGEPKKIFSAIKEADCLVLDDVGKEYRSEFAYERLFEFINDRYNSQKRLVITANYASEHEFRKSLGDKYGHYVLRRLKEMGTWIQINTEGNGDDKC